MMSLATTIATDLPQVMAGGLTDTVQTQSRNIETTLQVVVTVIAIGFVIYRAVVTKFAIGAILVAALVAGLVIWIVNNVDILYGWVGGDLGE